MLDIMYELPEQPAGSKWMINDEVISGKQKLFFAEPQSKSA